jgi:hypothetical protein
MAAWLRPRGHRILLVRGYDPSPPKARWSRASDRPITVALNGDPASENENGGITGGRRAGVLTLSGKSFCAVSPGGKPSDLRVRNSICATGIHGIVLEQALKHLASEAPVQWVYLPPLSAEDA